MLLSYTLDAGLNRHNLDLLSEIHLGHKTIQYKDLVGSAEKRSLILMRWIQIKPLNMQLKMRT